MGGRFSHGELRLLFEPLTAGVTGGMILAVSWTPMLAQSR